MATIIQVKDYFEYTSIKAFNEDWKKLSEEDKLFFKKGVAEATEL